MKEQRLFIVASRLPVCIEVEQENAIRPASTKLVNAVKTYLHSHDNLFSEFFWVGIPGCKPTKWNEATNNFFDSEFQYLPVLVYDEQYKKYHHGFAKSVIWPIFHAISSHAFKAEEYEQYISVNERYSEILEKKCRVNDTLWINDYHLLLLSGMARKIFPEIKIEFFLHIPFPPFEFFRLLPANCQIDLLKGMLGADFICFHSSEEIMHFGKAAKKVLSCSNDNNSIQYKGRQIKLDVFDQNVGKRARSKYEALKL